MEGEEPFRHVVIALKKEAVSERKGRYDRNRGGRYDRSGGYRSRRNAGSVSATSVNEEGSSESGSEE